MTLEQAYKLTKTSNMSQLGLWLGKTKQAVRLWDSNEIPLSVEREIKDQLSARKAERAEAKRLKMESKI
jgi:hypothetical protein